MTSTPSLHTIAYNVTATFTATPSLDTLYTIVHYNIHYTIVVRMDSIIYLAGIYTYPVYIIVY